MRFFHLFFLKERRIILKKIIFAVVIAFGGLLLSMDNGQCFTFTKEERVTGDRRIEALFARGSSFMAYPFRVVFLEQECSLSVPVSILISIPKKRIRSAVRRNRMKRITREAYRLNKHLLGSLKLPKSSRLDVAFIYVKDEVSDYTTVEKGMRKAMRTLDSQLDNGEQGC